MTSQDKLIGVGGSKWVDIRCDAFDDNEEKYLVESWKSNEKRGTVIAKLDWAANTVEYLDENVKTDDYAQTVIKEMMEDLKMNKDFIKAKVSGIKCDNPKCNYRDNTVAYEQYPEYINRPCPLCGENLLTEECYNKVKTMVDMAEKMNTSLHKITPNFLKKRILKKQVSMEYDVTKDGDLMEKEKPIS